ncbi:MAG: hypothetical protein EXR27_01970 [Betaproteobacteria bacterium]|nr:hypothetical protein [Betaproteobacteria bacterium]
MNKHDAIFTPRRLGHVNIFVSDVHASCAFYRTVCGLEQVYFEDDIQMGFMSNGRSNHDLGLMQAMIKPRIGRDGYVQPSTGRGHVASLNHMAFELESQKALVESYKRATAADVRISATSDHGLARSIYLFDPDGHMVEFYADAVEDWREFYRKGANSLLTGVWEPLRDEPSPTPLYVEDYQPARVADAIVHANGISSAALSVSNIERSIDFYQQVGGMSADGKRTDRTAVLNGSIGVPTLILVETPKAEKLGMHHMSLQLQTSRDFDGLASRLGSNGYPVLADISHSGGRSAFIRDRDGFLVELFHGSYGSAAAGQLPSV